MQRLGSLKSAGEDKEYLKGKDLSKIEDYKRKKTPLINDDQDNFKFMQIDVDYYTEEASQLPSYIPLRKGEEYAVLRMYGVTECGNSVMAHIHNFLSYFYCEVGPKHQEEDFSAEQLQKLAKDISAQHKIPGAVKHIECEMKASVMGYHEKETKFLKIYVGLPKYVSQLRQLFEQGHIKFNGKSIFEQVTYESNMPFALRFMIDNDIVGMQWI